MARALTSAVPPPWPVAGRDAFPVPLPPLELQRAFERRVQSAESI